MSIQLVSYGHRIYGCGNVLNVGSYFQFQPSILHIGSFHRRTSRMALFVAISSRANDKVEEVCGFERHWIPTQFENWWLFESIRVDLSRPEPRRANLKTLNRRDGQIKIVIYLLKNYFCTLPSFTFPKLLCSARRGSAESSRAEPSRAELSNIEK